MKQPALLLFRLWPVLLALLPGCATDSATSRVASETPARSLAPLPEAVTSFGAVNSDGWLYVFGGHKGERHDYSVEMVSGQFHRLRLSEGQVWESLPSAAPGQGQPLVAHKGSVYRIGGMAARNQSGSKQDLFSMALVQRFDPKDGQWRDFSSLPEARSSHDAVMVGNKLYVAGGWRLIGGTNAPVWPKDALVIDLNHPQSGWSQIPQPFQRRALALAAVGSRVFCIGGMNSDNQTTLAVDVYDTATGQWTKGPDLPPGKHKGFGCSAIAQNGTLYASAFAGDLLQLSKDGQSWEVVGRLEHPRMAHRLVTAGATELVALGGEDGESKRPELELLSPRANSGIARRPGPTHAAAAPAR